MVRKKMNKWIMLISIISVALLLLPSLGAATEADVYIEQTTDSVSSDIYQDSGRIGLSSLAEETTGICVQPVEPILEISTDEAFNGEMIPDDSIDPEHDKEFSADFTITDESSDAITDTSTDKVVSDDAFPDDPVTNPTEVGDENELTSDSEIDTSNDDEFPSDEIIYLVIEGDEYTPDIEVPVTPEGSGQEQVNEDLVLSQDLMEGVDALFITDSNGLVRKDVSVKNELEIPLNILGYAKIEVTEGSDNIKLPYFEHIDILDDSVGVVVGLIALASQRIYQKIYNFLDYIVGNSFAKNIAILGAAVFGVFVLAAIQAAFVLGGLVFMAEALKDALIDALNLHNLVIEGGIIDQIFDDILYPILQGMHNLIGRLVQQFIDFSELAIGFGLLQDIWLGIKDLFAEEDSFTIIKALKLALKGEWDHPIIENSKEAFIELRAMTYGKFIVFLSRGQENVGLDKLRVELADDCSIGYGQKVAEIHVKAYSAKNLFDTKKIAIVNGRLSNNLEGESQSLNSTSSISQTSSTSITSTTTSMSTTSTSMTSNTGSSSL
jgi:hypothetical protein